MTDFALKFDDFTDMLPDNFLESLFGQEILKRGWQVLVPANDADGEDIHPAIIEALLKRNQS